MRDQVPPWFTPKTGRYTNGAGRGPPKDSIPSIGADEIFSPLPTYEWLIEGLQIGRGRMTLLGGYADVGKTVIAQAVALSVASGKRVFDVFRVTKPGRVLHLDGEIGAYLARQRYQRLAAAAGVDVAALTAGDRLRLSSYPSFALDDRKAEEKLSATVEGFELCLVDSLTAFSGNLDENAKGIGRACYMFARVSELTGVTFIVLHHVTKATPDDARGGTKMRLRGSSSIPGAAGNIFMLTSLGKGKPAKVEHERALIGRTVNDFGVHIVDVPIGNDPLAGLRVVHLEPEQMVQSGERDDEAAHQALFQRASRKIVEVVIKHQPVHGNEALKGLVGMRYEVVKAALAQLLADGAVVNEGTLSRPRYVPRKLSCV